MFKLLYLFFVACRTYWLFYVWGDGSAKQLVETFVKESRHLVPPTDDKFEDDHCRKLMNFSIKVSSDRRESGKSRRNAHTNHVIADASSRNCPADEMVESKSFYACQTCFGSFYIPFYVLCHITGILNYCQ